MALDASNFHTITTGSPSLHYYKTSDARGDADASGYYSDITERLREHDVIILIASTGGTETVDLLIVTSATGAATVTTNTLS